MHDVNVHRPSWVDLACDLWFLFFVFRSYTASLPGMGLYSLLCVCLSQFPITVDLATTILPTSTVPPAGATTSPPPINTTTKKGRATQCSAVYFSFNSHKNKNKYLTLSGTPVWHPFPPVFALKQINSSRCTILVVGCAVLCGADKHLVQRVAGVLGFHLSLRILMGHFSSGQVAWCSTPTPQKKNKKSKK